MSQEKVDRYKEYKANKAKIIKKEKRTRRIEYTAALLVAILLVGWFAFSLFQKVEEAKPVEYNTYTMNIDSVSDYLSGLDAETEEAEEQE